MTGESNFTRTTCHAPEGSRQEDFCHLFCEESCSYTPPFKWDPESPISCAVQLPAELIGELAKFLASLGSPMDPELQIFDISHNPTSNARFTGEDIPNLVETINTFLSISGLHPLIPQNHEEWSIKRRHAMLVMAVQNFFWINPHAERPINEKTLYEFGYISAPWQNIVEEYTIVFSEPA